MKTFRRKRVTARETGAERPLGFHRRPIFWGTLYVLATTLSFFAALDKMPLSGGGLPVRAYHPRQNGPAARRPRSGPRASPRPTSPDSTRSFRCSRRSRIHGIT